jgi:hypothetical protein
MAHARNSAPRLIQGMFAAGVMICALPSSASAQWTVVNLHPAGATESQANGVSGDVQAGQARVDGVLHACLWNGSAESWVDLDPAGSLESWANGVIGDQQVGQASVPTYPHASLWFGTSASWVDLNPTGVTHSVACDAAAGQQVGIVSYNSNWRASLWSGSAATWVNLDPYLSSWSEGWGTDGGQQVGRARVGGVTAASLWSGTAASWVSLHPAGAMSSCAFDVHGGHQVGYLSVGVPHATLWSGTAASCVDLNPEGASESQALGVHLDQQVGYALIGECRAVLWNGSAASWVDLHAFLPPEYSESKALGISHGSATYVAGWGQNTVTGRKEALLWIGPLPASGVVPAEPATLLPFGPGRPNPSGGETRFSYSVRAEGRVRIDILDLSGRSVATLLDGRQPAGSGQVSWNAARLPAGIYFCRLSAADVVSTQKLVVVR